VKLLLHMQNDDKFKSIQKKRANRILNQMEDPMLKLIKIVDRFVSL
jgi:hypothetical protein